jgi:pimeloyl-ACP methyl ester carboxylesterase
MSVRQSLLAPVLIVAMAWSGCIPNPAASRPEWRRLVRTPAELGLEADTVSFVTIDSLRLRAWWMPAAGEEQPKATIVLAHGSGTNRSGMLGRARFLVRSGYNVLNLDLRAHGESEGKYMSPGWHEADDIRAAVAWIRSRPAAHSLPLIVLGHSYGAVAALHVATDSGGDVAAVIADAPFRSYDAMMTNARRAMKDDPRVSRGQRWGMALVGVPGFRHMAVWMMRRDGRSIPEDSARASFAVTRLRTPAVLFIAGERDAIATAPEVRLLHDSSSVARKEYVELERASHRTHGDAPEQYERAVLSFIRTIVIGR